MSDKKPRRRWFQFRLRSVLLLMLVVGLWLGYEVNWASRQQRHVAAIEKFGGSVEYGSYRWSLLRSYDPKKYGRKVTKAKISGSRVADAKPHLEDLSHLRRLTVVYDGTCDLYPHLDDLRADLPRVSLVPLGVTLDWSSLLGDIPWEREQVRRRELAGRIVERLRRSFRSSGLAKTRASDSRSDKMTAMFDQWKNRYLAPVPAESQLSRSIGLIDVRIVPLEDETIGEIICMNCAENSFSSNELVVLAVLMVGDRIADLLPRETDASGFWEWIDLDDVNGDGRTDIVRHRFSYRDSISDVYEVNSRGFHLRRDVSAQEKQRILQLLGSSVR